MHLCLYFAAFTVVITLISCNEENIFDKKDLIGSNLTTGVYYYITEAMSDKALRWDSNSYNNGNGLTYLPINITEINACDITRDYYLFELEIGINDFIRIKNKHTDLYISYFGPFFGFALSNSTIYNNSIGLTHDPTTGFVQLFTRVSPDNQFMSQESSFFPAIGIYSVAADSVSANYYFIEASNQSEPCPAPDPDLIDGTPLRTGVPYFINLRNNGSFLVWDGSNFTDNSYTGNGLQYSDNQSLTDRNDYLFSLERDAQYANQFRIRNFRTNNYISALTLSATEYLVLTNASIASASIYLLITHPTVGSINLCLSSLRCFSQTDEFVASVGVYAVNVDSIIAIYESARFSFIEDQLSSTTFLTTYTTTLSTSYSTPFSTPLSTAYTATFPSTASTNQTAETETLSPIDSTTVCCSASPIFCYKIVTICVFLIVLIL